MLKICIIFLLYLSNSAFAQNLRELPVFACEIDDGNTDSVIVISLHEKESDARDVWDGKGNAFLRIVPKRALNLLNNQNIRDYKPSRGFLSLTYSSSPRSLEGANYTNYEDDKYSINFDISEKKIFASSKYFDYKCVRLDQGYLDSL